MTKELKHLVTQAEALGLEFGGLTANGHPRFLSGGRLVAVLSGATNGRRLANNLAELRRAARREGIGASVPS